MRVQLSVVIPTLGRADLLRRALDRLAQQRAPFGEFEVLVVADAEEHELALLDRAVVDRPYSARRLQATTPGASAARNRGWREAQAPVVLFIDDDILGEPELIAQHLEWHRRHPEPEVGVLGLVRWADELKVTPFMRWLEHGIQFDYPAIARDGATWGHLYTANASAKRSLLEEVGGFDEDGLPFGYEDLDLARRMHAHGFELLYNPAAVAEHVHPMDLAFWKRRVARIAISEREFVARHPDVRPYFYDMFSKSMQDKLARGWGERLARIVPRGVPMIGERVWSSADAVYTQALARPFLDAWNAAQADGQSLLSGGGPK